MGCEIENYRVLLEALRRRSCWRAKQASKSTTFKKMLPILFDSNRAILIGTAGYRAHYGCA